MQPVTIILVYVVLWWLSFFIVLPFGMVSQADEGVIEPGTDGGAPARVKWKVKLIVTTVVAALLTVVAYMVVTYDLLGIGGYQ